MSGEEATKLLTARWPTVEEQPAVETACSVASNHADRVTTYMAASWRTLMDLMVVLQPTAAVRALAPSLPILLALRFREEMVPLLMRMRASAAAPRSPIWFSCRLRLTRVVLALRASARAMAPAGGSGGGRARQAARWEKHTEDE